MINLDESTPDALVRRLEQSGLRGRGGGWFPAARKWKAVRAEGGRPLVIANGAEGEPGSFKDRFVMRRRPDDVILKNISQIELSRHRSIPNFFVNVLCGLIAYCRRPSKPPLALDIFLPSPT